MYSVPKRAKAADKVVPEGGRVSSGAFCKRTDLTNLSGINFLLSIFQ
jgi:hypothetical protein